MADYVDVEELAAYLRLDIEEEDALANLACQAATEVVKQELRQDLLAANDEDDPKVLYMSGDGTSDAIVLPDFPIGDLLEVKVLEPGDVEADIDELEANDDYVFSARSGILYRRSGSWDSGIGNIKVTYTKENESVPYDVKLVCLQAAARIYDQGLVQSEGIGGYSQTYTADTMGALTDREKDILAKHRQRYETARK